MVAAESPSSVGLAFHELMSEYKVTLCKSRWTIEMSLPDLSTLLLLCLRSPCSNRQATDIGKG